MGRVTPYGAPLSSAGPRSKQAIPSPSHWLVMGPSPSRGAGEGLSIAPERQRTYVLLVEGAGRRAMTEGVQIREVGMRDGLQSIAEIMPTETKLAWLDAEYAAGVREIEVSSFVPPKLLPQLADAEAVIQHALTLPGLTVSALIPNLRGAERGLALGVHEMNFVLSVSEGHNLSNVRRTTDESIADFRRVVANVPAAVAAGCKALDASVGGLGGCPYAPGATGNIVLEDTVFMFESMGLETGIDLDSLAEARDVVARALPEVTLYGAIAKAGLPRNFHPVANAA